MYLSLKLIKTKKNVDFSLLYARKYLGKKMKKTGEKVDSFMK